MRFPEVVHSTATCTSPLPVTQASPRRATSQPSHNLDENSLARNEGQQQNHDQAKGGVCVERVIDLASRRFLERDAATARKSGCVQAATSIAQRPSELLTMASAMGPLSFKA